MLVLSRRFLLYELTRFNRMIANKLHPNPAILKDMDLKFGMHALITSYCLFKTVKKFMQIS